MKALMRSMIFASGTVLALGQAVADQSKPEAKPKAPVAHAAHQPLAAAVAPRTWTVDGVKREALVFAPTAKDPSGKIPVIFAFHGHGGNMTGASKQMNFQKAWPEALVIYMQGLPAPSRIDPAGQKNGWLDDSPDPSNRDLKFFDAVLASVRQENPVDDNRIYSAGFSNGGGFGYFLWAERTDTFAAIASCAGAIHASYQLTVPKPVVQITGKHDQVNPVANQKQAIETARTVNGATAAGTACGPGCTLFPSTKGAPVMAKFHNGGHEYPAWATGLIVKFFKDKTLAH